eukprot:GHVP01053108.1.p1 GENE.GHVP01053108.1~~GHVP01053108.1.p1  ORF type:complete len:802 (+),score=114.26 GHVP01053108.1:22-2406(+)
MDLESLENTVRNMFSGISSDNEGMGTNRETNDVDQEFINPDKRTKVSDSYTTSNKPNTPNPFPIPKEAISKEVYIESIEKNIEMSFIFQTPNQNYKRNPLKYVEYILTSKHKGSLYSLLRKDDLITSISFYEEEITKDFEHHLLTFILSSEGYNRRSYIKELVFSFLSKINQDGVNELLINQIKLLESNKFNYLEKVQSDEYVVDVSTAVHRYAPEDVLSGDYLFEGINNEELKDLMKYLTRDSILVYYLIPSIDVDDFNIERWYNVKYHTKEPEQTDRNMEHSDGSPLITEKIYPPENCYITTQEIKKQPSDIETHPILIEHESLEIWHRDISDNKIDLSIVFNLNVYNTPEMDIASRILIEMINEETREVVNQGDKAGLIHEMNLESDKFSIRFNGFKDVIIRYIEDYMDILSKMVLRNDMFDLFKDDIKKRILGMDEATPYKHARSGLAKTFLKDHFTFEDLKDHVDDVALGMAESIWSNIINRTDCIKILINGNISNHGGRMNTLTEDCCMDKVADSGCMDKPTDDSNQPNTASSDNKVADSGCMDKTTDDSNQPNTVSSDNNPDKSYDNKPLIELCEKIATFCKSNYGRKATNPRYHSIYEIKEIEHIKVNDTNSAVIYGIQLSTKKDLEHLINSFIFQDLIMEEFFDQLRTKEQLGYVTNCNLNNLKGQYVLTFTVQSEKSCEYLKERINRFIKEMDLFLLNINDDVFNDTVEARKDLLLKKEKSLYCYSEYYIDLINESYFDFEWKNKCIEILDKINKNTIIRFYKEHIIESNKAAYISVRGNVKHQ